MVWGQDSPNLIENGGFEVYSGCPTGIGQLEKASGWRSLNTGTPEYYHLGCGFASGLAAEGEGYAGLIIHGEYTDAIEYLTYQFDKPLSPGTYCFGISVRARNSAFFTDEFGLTLEKGSRYMSYWGRYKASYLWQLDTVLTPAMRWYSIFDEISIEEEKDFLILGNLSGKDDLRIVKSPTQSAKPGWDTYVFVDRVYLAEKEEGGCLTSFVEEPSAQSIIKKNALIEKRDTHVVYFHFNADTLSIHEFDRLQEFLATLSFDENNFTLEGHTDSVGSRTYNITLSKNRVASIKKLLLNRFPQAAIVEQAKGEEFPTATNASENGRALNRRVKIIVSNGSEQKP